MKGEIASPKPKRPQTEAQKAARQRRIEALGGLEAYREHMRQMSLKAQQAKRDNPKIDKGGRRKGQMPFVSQYQLAVMADEARKMAKKVMKKLDTDKDLPENAIARKAMQEALELLNTPQSTRDRLATIRTLLEFNMAKPASTQNVNLKTAEDFLDELANGD